MAFGMTDAFGMTQPTLALGTTDAFRTTPPMKPILPTSRVGPAIRHRASTLERSEPARLPAEQVGEHQCR